MCAPAVMSNVRVARRHGARVEFITPRAFRKLSGAAEPTGVAAVVSRRLVRLDRPAPGEIGLWLALGHIRSAGNLGTMLRTAAAAGVRGVMLLDDRSDPFDPVAVRASMGAVLSVRLTRVRLGHLAAWKRRVRALVVGTSSQATREYGRLPAGRSLVVMMGCEREGLSSAERRVCDLSVRIPMAPSVSSLNVAVAAGIVLFAARDRTARGRAVRSR